MDDEHTLEGPSPGPTTTPAAPSAQSHNAVSTANPPTPPSPCVSLGAPQSPDLPPLPLQDTEEEAELEAEPMSVDDDGEPVVAEPAVTPRDYGVTSERDNSTLTPAGETGPISTTEVNDSAMVGVSMSNEARDHVYGDWEFLPGTLAIIHRSGVCPDICDPFRGHLHDAHGSQPQVQDYAQAIEARHRYVLGELRPEAEQYVTARVTEREIALRAEYEDTLRTALEGQAASSTSAVADAERRREDADRRAVEAERLADDRLDEMTKDVARWASKAAHTGDNNKKLREELEASERRVREFRRLNDELERQQRATRRELEERLADNAALDAEVNERLQEIAAFDDVRQRLEDDLDYWKRQSNPYTREVDSEEEDAVSDTSSVEARKRQNKKVKQSFKAGAKLQAERARAASSNAFGSLDLTSGEPSSSSATITQKKKNDKGKGKEKSSLDLGEKRKRVDSGENELGVPPSQWMTASTNYDKCRLLTAHDVWVLMEAFRRFANDSARCRLNATEFTHQGEQIVGGAAPANQFILDHWSRLRDEGFVPARPLAMAPSATETPRTAEAPPDKRVRTGEGSQPQSGPSRPRFPPNAREGAIPFRGRGGPPRPVIPRAMRWDNDFIDPYPEPPLNIRMGPRVPFPPRGSRGGYGPMRARGANRGYTYDGYAVGPSYYNETYGPRGAWEALPPDEDDYYYGNRGYSPQVQPPPPTRGGNRHTREPISAPPTYENADDWLRFWEASGQRIPLGISMGPDNRLLRRHLEIHLLVHQSGPSRLEYPDGRAGRDMWRPEMGRFTQEVVGILSIPGLLQLSWEEYQLGNLMFAGTTRPHFPQNTPINRETVARHLRRVVRGPEEIVELEAWARRRRNAQNGRADEDTSPWPADSVPTHYNSAVLAQVLTTLGRSQPPPPPPAPSGGGSSSSASASGPSTQPRPATPRTDNDENMH